MLTFFPKSQCFLKLITALFLLLVFLLIYSQTISKTGIYQLHFFSQHHLFWSNAAFCSSPEQLLSLLGAQMLTCICPLPSCLSCVGSPGSLVPIVCVRACVCVCVCERERESPLFWWSTVVFYSFPRKGIQQIIDFAFLKIPICNCNQVIAWMCNLKILYHCLLTVMLFRNQAAF